MKKGVTWIYALLAMTLVAGMVLSGCAKPTPAPASPTAAGEVWPKAVTWGGTTTGASYTILGADMSRMIQKHTNVTATAEPIGGGAANVLALHRKEIEFSCVIATDSYDAPRGRGEYKETGPINICSLFAGHHFLLSGVVRADSGINSPADWRGKRLMCKSPTSAMVFAFVERILPEYNIALKDVIIQPLPGSSDRIVAMTEKTTDALFAPYTEAQSYLLELFQRTSCRIVPLDEDKLESMIKKDPTWYKAKMPAGCYPGQDKDIMKDEGS